VLTNQEAGGAMEAIAFHIIDHYLSAPETDWITAFHAVAEQQLAELIVSSLNLENIQPAAIPPDAPLFGGELGLDSIDALEIALAVSKRYGFPLRSDNSDNRRIFASLRALSQHIEQHRTA